MYDYANYGAMATFKSSYSIWMLAITIFFVVVNWLLFKKANKHGWAAIIPVYNTIVKYQIAKVSPWLLLLFLVPFVNFIAAIVLGIIVNVNLAKVFGKGTGFAVGLIFLPFIFLPILAFGKAEYQG